MAKRTTKQGSSPKAGEKPPATPAESSEATSSSLIASIYARRYGTTPADGGVGVTPPSGTAKPRARRK